MRELDVRTALLAQLREQYQLDGCTRILNEFAVGGGIARIDVAVVNGQMIGIEIKSDSDTLDRLPSQAAVYNDIFDLVTVVCGNKHFSKVEKLIPDWWRIVSAVKSQKGIVLSEVRAGSENPCVDPTQIARLLWKEEALYVLEKYGITARLKNKPRAYLVATMCHYLSIHVIQSEVRECIKARVKWRVDEQHALCGGSSQLVAT